MLPRGVPTVGRTGELALAADGRACSSWWLEACGRATYVGSSRRLTRRGFFFLIEAAPRHRPQIGDKSGRYNKPMTLLGHAGRRRMARSEKVPPGEGMREEARRGEAEGGDDFVGGDEQQERRKRGGGGGAADGGVLQLG